MRFPLLLTLHSLECNVMHGTIIFLFLLNKKHELIGFICHCFNRMRLQCTLGYVEGFTDSLALAEQLLIEDLAEIDTRFVTYLGILLHANDMLSTGFVKDIACELRVTACHKDEIWLDTLGNQEVSKELFLEVLSLSCLILKHKVALRLRIQDLVAVLVLRFLPSDSMSRKVNGYGPL